jgi:hypothetical protein
MPTVVLGKAVQCWAVDRRAVEVVAMPSPSLSKSRQCWARATASILPPPVATCQARRPGDPCRLQGWVFNRSPGRGSPDSSRWWPCRLGLWVSNSPLGEATDPIIPLQQQRVKRALIDHSSPARPAEITRRARHRRIYGSPRPWPTYRQSLAKASFHPG